MSQKEKEQIIRTEYSDVMKKSYIDYAMSVIISRALPDVRDGLKPVQRRALYDMYELGIRYDRPYRKCARIVGDTMGKYHPHGDSSIYEALVVMAQDFKKGMVMVDGHGNFGSIEGDGAAAMRYTEARLAKVTQEAFLADLDKDIVNFVPNFDETEKEPLVLPSRFPNLLVNGTSGIAVGMATNIPPHNLREVIGAVSLMIDNRINEDRDTTLEEIMEVIKGPDFPTGATILGRRGIEEAYRTGRAKIKVRAVTNIETMANGKSRIIVTELPYMVNKARLIEKIADLVKEKKVDGITYIGDACRLAKKYFRNVGLEIYPCNTKDYAYLHECGADYVTVFQETYNADKYETLHLMGHKRVFPYRFEAQERALMGGMRGVGFSALLGLSAFRKDALATALHVYYLQRKYPHAEMSLSCPRLRPIINNEKINPLDVHEKQLCQVLCAYRIFLPYAGITVSSRESASFRNGIIKIACTKVSAGVSTGIGDHEAKYEGSEEKDCGDEQFEIADTRSLKQMYDDIKQQGLWPVLNDYLYV